LAAHIDLFAAAESFEQQFGDCVGVCAAGRTEDQNRTSDQRLSGLEPLEADRLWQAESLCESLAESAAHEIRVLISHVEFPFSWQIR
jgi:hypothetical protein